MFGASATLQDMCESAFDDLAAFSHGFLATPDFNRLRLP